MGLKKEFAQFALMLMLMCGISDGFALNLAGSEDIDKEVSRTEIPKVVSSAIEEEYPGYDIHKIYKRDDGSFMVELENGNEKVTAFYDINGELLRVQDNNNGGNNDG